MSDDLECLRIHRGGKEDDTSTDDDEEDITLNQAYCMMKPSPIPQDIIRERAIYRPPSPDEEESVEKKPAVGNLQGMKQKFQEDDLNYLKCLELKDLKLNGNDSDSISIILNDLIENQRQIYFTEKRRKGFFRHIKELRFFVIDVIEFERSIGSLEYLHAFHDLEILISYFYAFILIECLSVYKHWRYSKRHRLVRRSISVIGKIGKTEETIALKISKANSKSCNILSRELNIEYPAPLQWSNDVILKWFRVVPMKKRKTNIGNHSTVPNTNSQKIEKEIYLNEFKSEKKLSEQYKSKKAEKDNLKTMVAIVTGVVVVGTVLTVIVRGTWRRGKL